VTTTLGIPALRPGLSRNRTPGDDRRLVDLYGRVATDLRVSVTDRCNLRCAYCMPAEGLDWLPSPDLLTNDEIIRLVRIAVKRLGVTEVRFTGGEPLLRKGLESIIADLDSLSPRPEISLTTNGIGLRHRAAALRSAGLDRVNVSVDTLRRDRFAELTKRDRLPDVFAGLAAAKDAGLAPIKINAVLMKGVNADEAAALLHWALASGYELRFIEQMPLDAQRSWDRDRMVTAADILAGLCAEFNLQPDQEPRADAPAERFLVDGGPARVGIIAAVTRPFCQDCNRTRLTADGQVRNCLFATSETDLRELMRNGGSDDDLAEAWRTAMRSKLPGHGINDPAFLQPSRPMSAIGG
jgi:GTP 3',8-cyclase